MERTELLLDVFSEAEEAAVQRRKGARMRRRRRWRGYVIGRKWRRRRGKEEAGRPEGRPWESTTSCDGCVLVAGASRLAAGQRRKTKRDATINSRTEAVRLLRVRARSRRPEGRPRERTTSCADGVLAAGASRLAAGQRRKTKRDATINSRTEAVRLLRVRARSRRPEGRPRERTTSCADGVLAAGASRLAAGQRRKTKRDATINSPTEALRLLRVRARSRDRPPGRRRRATAVLATARVTTLGSCGGGGGAQRQTQRRSDAWRRRRAVISQVMVTVSVGLKPSWRFCWRCRSAAIFDTSCVRPFNFTA